MTTSASQGAISFLPTSSSMVSQPFTAERSLAVRRPSSVSARSTTSRRHRSHRSHHGGSSYQPQNEFPVYAHTGDVEIVIAIDGQEKRYMLHRLILAQCSGFFEASTSEVWPQHQTQALSSPSATGETRLTTIGEDSDASSSSRTMVRPIAHQQAPSKPMWRYELDKGRLDSEDEIPMLVQKPFTATSFGSLPSLPPPPVRDKPQPPSNGFFRSVAAMQTAIHLPGGGGPVPQQKQPDSEVIRDYDNLFRIFYNYAPNLDSVDITEAYIQCKTLLTLADMFDALEVVGPRVDHHLLTFGNRLWKQIAKYPPSYLKLSYLARSKAIFAESLVHVVGQWPLAAGQLQSVPDSILDLIEDKYADLDDLKARVEGRLFRLTFTTQRGERVSPTNAYSEWLVVSLFRHWLAENLTASTPPIPKPSSTHPPVSGQVSHVRHGSNPTNQRPPSSSNAHQPNTTATIAAAGTSLSSGRVFRLLGAGGPAYLGHDEIKRFIKNKGEGEYTRDYVRRFEKKMDELKGLAKEVVRPLMKNYLELEGAGSAGIGSGSVGGSAAGAVGLGYLTCTKVEEGDFPW